MCGIFGIVLNNNNENIFDLIINGLIQLQNRGYDSAGLSVVVNNNKMEVYKYASTNEEDAITKLSNLNLKKVENTYIGIGHNRWATHGVKNDDNAHPHLSNDENFSLVHNGIIENYNDLKQLLILNKFIFKSQTDTEVVVNLIEFNYNITKNTFEAIEKTISLLRGTYGLLIQSLYEPNKLFCVRNGSPLLVGQNENCVIVTSEQSGFCNMMNNYITLHTDDICTITKTNDKILFSTSKIYSKNNVYVLDSEISPSPYKHWTLKEIYEQPNVVLNSINKGGRIRNNYEVKLGGLEKYSENLKSIHNISN